MISLQILKWDSKIKLNCYPRLEVHLFNFGDECINCIVISALKQFLFLILRPLELELHMLKQFWFHFNSAEQSKMETGALKRIVIPSSTTSPAYSISPTPPREEYLKIKFAVMLMHF